MPRAGYSALRPAHVEGRRGARPGAAGRSSPARGLATGAARGWRPCAQGRHRPPSAAATAACTPGIPRGARPGACSPAAARSPGSSRRRGRSRSTTRAFARSERGRTCSSWPRAATRLLVHRLARGVRRRGRRGRRPRDLLAFCRSRGLGLDEATVARAARAGDGRGVPAGKARDGAAGRCCGSPPRWRWSRCWWSRASSSSPTPRASGCSRAGPARSSRVKLQLARNRPRRHWGTWGHEGRKSQPRDREGQGAHHGDQDPRAGAARARARAARARARADRRAAAASSRRGELARQYAKMDVSWARCSYAKAARAALLGLGLGPMIDFYVRNRVVGGEIFDTLSHPVIFVANHSSHLDTPDDPARAAAQVAQPHRGGRGGRLLLQQALEGQRRRPAVQHGAARRARAAGSATARPTTSTGSSTRGWNLVMFPEGTRSRDGEVGKVHSGAAVIAAQHGIDIVPIYLAGTHEAMPPGRNWPKRMPGPLLLEPPRGRGPLRRADRPRADRTTP